MVLTDKCFTPLWEVEEKDVLSGRSLINQFKGTPRLTKTLPRKTYCVVTSKVRLPYNSGTNKLLH